MVSTVLNKLKHAIRLSKYIFVKRLSLEDFKTTDGLISLHYTYVYKDLTQNLIKRDRIGEFNVRNQTAFAMGKSIKSQKRRRRKVFSYALTIRYDSKV